jgi:two-component system, LytTR family, response regulator
MIKALLIDDEENNIIVLKGMIEKFIPEITTVYTAIGGKQGVQAVHNYNPDLIFLDIEMPVMNGFDLLQKFSGKLFDVIFVTAYSHYAIKAVRFSALDYLLKPVDKDELKSAVQRYTEKIKSQTDLQYQYENFLQNLKNKNNNKLAISTVEGIHFLMPSNIIRCEAEGSYTKFYLADKKTVTTSKDLKEYDQILSDHDFIRVHRAHLINRSYINSISGDHQLTLTDNTLIEVSRRKWDEVKKILVN